MDFQQNYALTSGEWKNNKLLARFHRQFDTCDPLDYAIDVSTNKSSSNTPFVFQSKSHDLFWNTINYVHQEGSVIKKGATCHLVVIYTTF